MRPLVPHRLWLRTNRVLFAGVGLALRGKTVHCSCCGRSYRRFVAYPTDYCPGCGSYARQRLLCLYLDASPELVEGDVLQVGPERSVMERYRPGAGSWLAIDVDPDHPLADRTMDLRELPLADASFDLILCSHVLDIVEPHDKAISELFRVTRRGGRLIVQAPWRSVHGAPDVYASQLERAGFRVTPLLLGEQRDDVTRRRLGLDRDDPLFICLR